MDRLRHLVLVAVCAGLCAGMASTVVQAVGTGPLIARAEVFEAAAMESGAEAADVGHDHAGHAMTDHDHAVAWEPADGAERTGFTLAANLLLGIGYGLVLAGLMTLEGGRADWRRGLLWGLGGFAATMLAPALGLPPELPGMPAADLAARQAWWIATVLATAAGLSLLAFRRGSMAWMGAAILILAPHIVGAPIPPSGSESLVPEDLETRFVFMALASGLAFWALLGTVGGAVLARLEAHR